MAPRLRALCLVLCLTLSGLAWPGLASADPAQFDLTGPSLEIRVTHAGKTLPIAQVPNLSPGDLLWMKADLPPTQSVRYLLVAAFLRGATNPPPPAWFFQSQTWKAGGGALRITVPQGAQQVLVFLAPETGGDFKTIVDAVRGRPGAFVRASQDLNQATLDRSRLDAFLAAIRRTDRSDPDALKTVSPLLARSLIIKFDSTCLQKMAELQAPCLMQGQDSLVLNDGHSTSIVQALSSGSTADLVQQLSNTPRAGMGYYSPYIASLMDMARIMDSLHTAQYQYIPALGAKAGDQLSLLLNTPPSFHDPKSVLVVALPAVEGALSPPLHPLDPGQSYCAERSPLVLPAEGAPLVFSTDYAHDLVLRLKQKNGKPLDLPVRADAEQGGLVVDAQGLDPADFGDVIEGEIHGFWGFEPYDGPRFRLENAHRQHWRLDADDRQALVAGHDGEVRLTGPDASCVEAIVMRLPSGETESAAWKAGDPGQVRVTAPLRSARPGAFTLVVRQYGGEAASVPVEVFGEPSRLDGFAVYTGDAAGVLKGARLDQVSELGLDGVVFKPAQPGVAHGDEALPMAAEPAAAARLSAAGPAQARVTLKDGRILAVGASIRPPRPRVALIAKTASAGSGEAGQIQLGDPDELAQGERLTFSIRALPPTLFTGEVKVEVATADGAFATSLGLANGLTIADPAVAVATLDTAKAFGASAFGPLRFRLVENGAETDWQPLATLVRLPTFDALRCPAEAGQPCKLAGSDLFLVDAVSADPGFGGAVQVPAGFTGAVLSVPHAVDGRLYVKLHDDPSVANLVVFPAKGRPAGHRSPPHRLTEPSLVIPPSSGGQPIPPTGR